MSWRQLVALADQFGGDLVSISDAAEEEWLYSQFGPDFFWIGFTDQAVKGEWVWTSGETVSYGTGDCLWRMEVTIENFHGGGKTFTPNLGSPRGSRILYSPSPRIDVKGKATNLVWEYRKSLTDFPAVASWAVNVANNKGQKDHMTRVLPVEDSIMCK